MCIRDRAYGERWARHWLDVAGYADSDGYTANDTERKWAWKYRDYVIRSLNADKPWNQFLVEQLAGDELLTPPYQDLKPEQADQLIATGFLLCGPDMPDINDQDERRHTVLNELTGTVGAVFLGLPLGCAQCHDHKTDPVSQHDVYGLLREYCGPRKGGMLGEATAILTDDNGDEHEFSFETFGFYHECLTLGIHLRKRAVVVSVVA